MTTEIRVDVSVTSPLSGKREEEQITVRCPDALAADLRNHLSEWLFSAYPQLGATFATKRLPEAAPARKAS